MSTFQIEFHLSYKLGLSETPNLSASPPDCWDYKQAPLYACKGENSNQETRARIVANISST